MTDARRPQDMERITNDQLADAFIEEQIQQIKQQVGDKKVLLALSGRLICSCSTFNKSHWQTTLLCSCKSRTIKNG